MDSGAAGTSGEQAGSSGGVAVTSGSKATWRLLLAAALIAYGALQTYANVASTLSDNERLGEPTVTWQLWATELSSLISWTMVAVLLWLVVIRVGPPRFSWPALTAIYLAAGVAASALHVAVMIALRELVWWVRGDDYNFAGGFTGWPYELRKDLAIYVILLAAFALVEWFLKPASRPQTSDEPVTLTISEGSRTFQVPADEIESIEAAGNYVEVHHGDRILLHRATMQAMEDELMPAGFVRIHRSALVRRSTIRTIDVAQSGDFTVELENGRSIRGSRRYRSALD